MKTPKPITLTQREQLILKAMRDGEELRYMPYEGRFNPNAYFYIGNLGNCTREAKKLIKLGLVEEARGGIRGYENKYLLTVAGKTFNIAVEEGTELWIVDHAYIIRVSSVIGTLAGSRITTQDGAVIRTSDTKTFFTTKNDAFDYAIERQEQNVRIAEGKVRHEGERLKELQELRELKPTTP